MRAVVIPILGGPDVLRVVELPRPTPKPGEVLVKLRYAGVMYGDIYQRQGTYREGRVLTPSETPLRIGYEGSGVVTEVGPEVEGFKEGDRVVFCEQLGSYGEYSAVPAWRAQSIPKDIGFREAAAAFSLGATAHYLAYDTGRLAPGLSCLVHAGAGGLGHLLLQFARKLGAHVLTTVGSEAKADFARRLGADKVVNYRACDFLDEVRAWTSGRGVDVVYDSVGAATIERSILATRLRGLCVLCGSSSGHVETIAPMRLAAAGSIFFTRPRFSHHMRNRDEVRRRADCIFDSLRDGSLAVTVGAVLPLERAPDAHRLLEARQTIGKVLLEIG